jgi:hypothetical protein
MTKEQIEARFRGAPDELAEFNRLTKKLNHTPQELARLSALVGRYLQEDPPPLYFEYYAEPKLSAIAVLPEPFTAEDVAKAWDMPVCHALGFLQRWSSSTGGWLTSDKPGEWTRTRGVFPTLETLRELRSQRDAARAENQRHYRAAGRPYHIERQRRISYYPDDDRFRRICEKALSDAEREEYNLFFRTKGPNTHEEIERFNGLLARIHAYDWDHPNT